MTLCDTLGPIPINHHVSNRNLHQRNQNGTKHTLIKTRIPLLPNNPVHRLSHALLLVAALAASDVHLALDSDIRIRHAGRKQLAQRTEAERNSGRNPPLLLDRVLHLLEQGVLQNRVDD